MQREPAVPKSTRAKKSYRNPDFLNSPDARGVRILCEFFEPASRFRRLRIKNTIVFFGSARLKSSEDARAQLEEVKSRRKIAVRLAGHEGGVVKSEQSQFLVEVT